VKKFVNDPKQFVPEFLEGVALASDGTLKYEPKYNLIYRADMPKPDRISIIQGSGSGHEPAHTMIVGPGMLDAACPGDVFAGPPVEFVTETSKLMDTPAGVLYIVNNYTGDRTAWEMARELQEAEGQKIGYLLVNDDVAVKDSTWTVGRRGVAGNFFVIKAAAAKADKGGTLEECVAVGEKVIANVRTMGIALSSCTPPVRGTPLFEIGDDEMEIGIGIHGEPGRERRKLATADEITEMLAIPVIDDLPFTSGDRVLAFVNGMGGTPLLELYVIYRKLAEILDGRGITIARNLIGNYITSLEMAGCSITLLKLDDELIRLWDAPVHTPALRWGV
jgi:dihydroxyacetone kinase-like protein